MPTHLESSAPLTCNSRLCFPAGDFFYFVCSPRSERMQPIAFPPVFLFASTPWNSEQKLRRETTEPLPLSLLALEITRIPLITAALTWGARGGSVLALCSVLSQTRSHFSCNVSLPLTYSVSLLASSPGAVICTNGQHYFCSFKNRWFMHTRQHLKFLFF